MKMNFKFLFYCEIYRSISGVITRWVHFLNVRVHNEILHHKYLQNNLFIFHPNDVLIDIAIKIH